MPDLSADRPLLLPNQDLEALELLLLEPCNVECMFYRPNSAACPGCSAVAVLRHFGPRLLPPSAKHHDVWNIRLPKPGGYPIVDDALTKSWPPESGEIADDVKWWKEHKVDGVVPVRRRVTTFGDGSTLLGPWTEVDGSGADHE